MKGCYALHEGKYKKILDIKDSGKPAHVEGGGNYYTLEGVKEPVHASKLKEVKLPSEMKKREDKIPGGLADKSRESDFDKDALAEGIKIEMEHTSDKNIAQEIAMDHLTEDPKYYKKLKEVEKQERVEMSPDGKIELDVGKEPLDKLKSRWSGLKKALDSNIAIMSVEGQEYNPEEDEPSEENPQEEAPDIDQPQSEESKGQDLGDGSEASEEAMNNMSEDEIIQTLKEEGYSDSEISHIVHGHILPEATVDDYKVKNEKMDGEIEQAHKLEDTKLDRDHKKRMHELEYQKMKDEMSDPETEKGHRRRMLDLEYETEQGKKKQSDAQVQHQLELQALELAAKKRELEKENPQEDAKAQEARMAAEHKKRMMDLEYEKAKKESEKPDPTDEMKVKQMEFEMAMKRMEKELELEFKKKELALKLKLTEEAARQKHEHAQQQAEADAAVNAEVKANQAKHKISESKKAPPKDPKKNVK